jgi:flagellar hook-length control protein FliK
MSQIQFDAANVAPRDPSPAYSSQAKSSGGSDGDSFDAYLHKAQSASTASAKTSASDKQSSDSQSSPNSPAQDAQAETAHAASTQAAEPKPAPPQSKVKNRDPQNATPRDANPVQTQTQTGNGHPATLSATPAANVPLVATGSPSPSTTTPTALPAAPPVAPDQPAAAATANTGATPTPTPAGRPLPTTDAQAAIPAAAATPTDVETHATDGGDAQNRGGASTQGASESTIATDQVPQRPIDLPAAAAATPDGRPGPATAVQAGLAPGVQAAAASADRDLNQNASPAAAVTQVQAEQEAQAKTAATGVAPGGSAESAERKKNAVDQAGDNSASLAGPAINPDATAGGLAATAMPAAASDPTTVVEKDKQSAADMTVNAVTATATAGTNASPGAAASPLQNSSQAGGAAAAPQAGSVGQTDQTRFLQRVTAAFQSVGDHSGSVRIMLSPPELGSLRLEVSIQNGAMSAHLQAETPAARNLLLDNLPALRDRLAGQNIKVDRFDVDLMDRQPHGGTSGQTSYQSNTNSQGSYRGNSSGGLARGSGGRVGSVAAVAASTPDSPVVETTRLNVVV